MKKYFNNVRTLSELRSQYKELLKRYHPDNGGSEESTKAINVEYEELFKVLKNRHENSSDRKENNTEHQNMKYDFAEDAELRAALQKLICFGGIIIEICGSFIWVSGNTYQYKKEFKKFNFKWASQKKQWYWRPETYKKKSHKTLSMEDIRNYYGSTRVETNARILLEA